MEKSASVGLLNDSNLTDKPHDNFIHLQPTLHNQPIYREKVKALNI